MKGMVPPDPQTNVSNIEYAVVHVPRKSRNRFAAGCVDIKPSASDAQEQANPDNKLFAARVSGPSKSSEGQYIYYLVEWLE
jgi:hypothetical protein